jgi:hypothetical protein
MSNTRYIKYVIHYTVKDGSYWTPHEWYARKRNQRPGDGKPTEENIAKHCRHMEASTLPGGVNAHIGKTKMLSAYIVDQRTGSVVAQWGRD